MTHRIRHLWQSPPKLNKRHHADSLRLTIVEFHNKDREIILYTVLYIKTVLTMHTPIPLSCTSAPVVLFHAPVYAGFPSPAADYAQHSINLAEHLITNDNASFLFRVRGESMSGIGIYDGDTLIVDRSISPRHNHIVLAIIDEEFTVKRLYKQKQVIKLIAENLEFPPIELKEGQELRIWGVVTFNLHSLLSV